MLFSAELCTSINVFDIFIGEKTQLGKIEFFLFNI